MGYAPEFMEAAYAILRGEPDDYVIGTGEAVSIEEMADWLGIKDRLVVNERFFRPLSPGVLTADYSKAAKAFGFNPQFKGKALIDKIYGNYNPSK